MTGLADGGDPGIGRYPWAVAIYQVVVPCSCRADRMALAVRLASYSNPRFFESEASS